MSIDKNKTEMRVLDFQMAREIIVENHYSHAMPCCELALGFYIDNVLNCVIVFGQSATPKMAKSLPSTKYWELSRLFSFDWGGKCIESYCIGQALKYIERNYDKDLIISFADPSEGHAGAIYQATNWLYCGMSQSDKWYIVDKKKIHPRSMVAKYGTRSEKKLHEMGVIFTREELAGKHRYVYLFGSRRQKKELLERLKYPVLPYPKKVTPEEVSRVIRPASSREGRVRSPHSALSNAGGSIKGDTPCVQQGGAGSIPALRFERRNKIAKILRARSIFPKILQDVLPEGEVVPMKQGKKEMIPALAQEDVGFQLLLAHSNDKVRLLCKAKAACTSWPLHQAKVQHIIKQAECSDGKARVAMKFYGAHTGRWSGTQGTNMLNLGGKGRGKAIHPLIGKVRHSLLAPEGQTLAIADSAQIEARELAWISGQNDLVKGFADGQDIYSVFATRLFGEEVRKPTDADPPGKAKLLAIRRGFGKDAILGCGYGMGTNTFFDRCRQNESLRPLFDSGEYDWDFIDKLIKTYRTTYAQIPKFWGIVEKCFRWVTKYPNEVMTYYIPADDACLHEGMEKQKPLIKNAILTFWKEGTTTIIQLPSGRRLFYRHATVDAKGKIDTIHGPLWGGSITENIIQSICRDLLGGWLLECEREGIPIILHTYDELVGCVPEHRAEESLAKMIEIMRTGPDWAAGLPLDAEGGLSACFKK